MDLSTEFKLFGAGILSGVMLAVMLFYVVIWLTNEIMDDETESIVPGQTAYCFECEINMPIRIDKNNYLRCSNCGLLHTQP